jgi:filamentous hemagglutinin family protein
MNSKPESMFTLRRVSAAVMSALLAGQSVAGPIGGQVVGGSGSISQTGATTAINQSTQNMAINWQSYNINANERVQYIQPNSSSIALNRILSNNGSVIAGRIDANGQVILVNPNGVFFTPTSVVNVGGIIASGLNIAPSDFMNGNYIFNEVLGTDGKVINSGTINASLGGNVTLIGKQVDNDGLIVANLGTVNLAAGKQAVLTFDNGGLLGVRVSKEILQDELGVDPAVMNSGEIHAEGGRVLLTARTSQDVFSRAVNTSGMEQATSVVVNEDGSFTLGGGADVVNSGTIDTSTVSSDQGVGRIVLLGENVFSSGKLRADAAGGNAGEIELHAQDTTLLTGNSFTSARAESDGNGGTIKVLGDEVGLFDVTMVDASGANGGGKVLIGGDYQGSNPAVRNARRTLLAPDAKIFADALEYGDGGIIVSWSDDSTWFYGSAYSRGGAAQGNGGLIEISGKGLSFNGQVDTGAEHGSVGAVLFDPTNIVIINGSGGASDSLLTDPFPVLSGATIGDFEISESKLESLANTSSIILEATENITIEELTTDHALNLRSSTGSITFTADSNGDGSGTFVMNQNDTIQTRGGSIAISGEEITAGHLSTSWDGRDGGSISISSSGGIDVGNIDTRGGSFWGAGVGKAGGNVALTAGTGIAVGTINTSASDSVGDVNAAAGNAGTISITATGGTADVELGGQLTANGGNGPTSATSSDGNDGSGGDGGLISITAGQDILTNSASAISSNGGNGPTVTGNADGDGGVGGGVTLSAGRDIFVDATISSNGGNGPTSTNGGADGNGGSAGEITVTVARNLTISAGVNSLGGTKTGGGSGSAGADGAISFNGGAADNTFTINDNITLAGSTVTVNGGGGNDQLVRGGTVATPNAWTVFAYDAGVDGINDGTLAFGNNTGTDAIRFADIESLLGGDGQDAFVIESTGNIDGLIDGGLGTVDSLQINRNGIVVQLGDRAIGVAVVDPNLNVARVETVAANAASISSNEIRSDDVASTWLVDGSGSSVAPTANLADAAQFSYFGNLTGSNQGDEFSISAALNGTINAGTGDDNIAIQSGGSVVGINAGAGDDAIELASSVSGLIDGGAHGVSGGDTVTITAGAATTVQLGDIDSDADYKVVNVETLAGNVAYENTLRGDDGSNTWTIDALNSGSINGTITFENFANLVGGGGQDRFEMIDPGSVLSIDGGTGGGNTLVARQGVTNVWNFATTSSGSLAQDNADPNPDETYVGNFQNIQAFVGGGVGNEWADFSGNPGAIVDLSAANYFGFDGIIGNGANSTLHGQDGEVNVWTMQIVNDSGGMATDGKNDGIFSNGNGSLTFIDFANIVGGDSVDNVLISANGSITGLIDGNSGVDTIDIQSAGNKIIELGNRVNDNLNVFRVEEMTANVATYNELIGDSDSTTNTWALNGPRNGTIDGGAVTTAFTNIDAAIGGPTTDNFTMAGDFSGLIDGGAGTATDTLLITAGGDRVIELGNLVNANTNVYRMETLTANTSARNELIGDSALASYSWTLDGTRAGSVDDGVVTTIFSSIDDVAGGTAADDFTLAGDFAGLVDGGLGTDSLTTTAGGDRTIELGDLVNANTNVYRLENITANSGTNNELVADSTEAISNTWTISGANSGWLVSGANNTDFSNIQNLTGTAVADNFTISGDSSSGVSGVIDGMDGSGIDRLRITATGDRVVELGDRTNANLNVYRVENVTANSGYTNQLIADSNAAINTWSVTGSRSGVVSDGAHSTSFSYFDELYGGSTVDRFTVNNLGAVAVINSGAGDDDILIAASANIGSVNLGAGSDSITVSGGAVGPIAMGDGNDFFEITSGTVNGDVNGDAGDDTFTNSGGAITGTMSGDADTDYIVYTNPVDITLGTDIGGFEGVTAQNNDGTLRARTGQTTTWTITGGNSGNVSDSSEGLAFVGFSTLVGGDGQDNFDVRGGSISGTVNGAGGDDVLDVQLAANQQGQIQFIGGAGTNDVVLSTSSGVAYDSGVYSPNVSGYDQLRYTDDTASYYIRYDNQISAITDNAQVTSFAINSSGSTDIIRLGFNTATGKNTYKSDASIAGIDVEMANKPNVSVSAINGSDVEIAGNVNVAGTLSLITDQITQTAGANVVADTLLLQNVGTVGALGDGLNTSIDNLHVIGSGPVYIDEQDNVTLAGLNTSVLVDITAGGSINSSTSLVASGMLNLVAVSSIDLTGQTNQLSGPLTLVAGNDISLANSGLTTLARVSAPGNLTLNAGGDIIVSGAVTVGGVTDITSAGNVNLTNVANDFNIVNINAPGMVTLRDANNIAGGSLTAGSIVLTTDTGVGNSASRLQTNTAELTISNATSGGIYVQNSRDLQVSITNLGDIELSSSGSVIIERLYANGGDYSAGQAQYTGDVRLITQNRPVSAYTGSGAHDQYSAPDIVGQNLYVETVASDLGNIGRPISIRVNDTFAFVGARGYVFYYGGRPNNVVNASDLVEFTGIASISGQQLIEIESLGDVDEAVFTDVRNYYHEDVAIMMPADQRMTDDEDEEEQRRRGAVN